MPGHADSRQHSHHDPAVKYKWTSHHAEDQQPGLGRSFMDEVSVCLEYIEQRPLSFAVVNNPLRRAMTRRFPYALFFAVGRKHAGNPIYR